MAKILQIILNSFSSVSNVQFPAGGFDGIYVIFGQSAAHELNRIMST